MRKINSSQKLQNYLLNIKRFKKNQFFQYKPISIYAYFILSLKMFKSTLEPYSEPDYPAGIKIYVSQPYISEVSFQNVVDSMLKGEISSKTLPNQTFESNLKLYFNVPTACSVSNGYTALFVILKALKNLLPLQKNQIILPTSTMVAVVNAVIDNGFIPCLIDNGFNKLNPQYDIIKSKITKNTLAIIVTHTYGVPMNNLDQLMDFACKNDIILIEDIAQAIGVRYKGNFVGTYGHFAAGSLYANKLITSGDGGFILSKMKQFKEVNLNEYFKTFINHGFTKKYHFHHCEQTGNYRMNGLGSAFISNFHLYIDRIIEQRKILDSEYRKRLTKKQYYTLMEENQTDVSTPWVFSLMVNSHQILILLRKHLAELGIQTRPYFKPIHSQNFMKNYLKGDEKYPNSQIQYLTGLYLPTYYNLRIEQIDYICNGVNSYFEKIDVKLLNANSSSIKLQLLDYLSEEQIYLILNGIVQKYESFSKKNKTQRIKQTLNSLQKILREDQQIQLSKKPITTKIKQNKQNKSSMQIIIDQSSKEICLSYPIHESINNIKENNFFRYDNQQKKIFQTQLENTINFYQQLKSKESDEQFKILKSFCKKIYQFHHKVSSSKQITQPKRQKIKQINIFRQLSQFLQIIQQKIHQLNVETSSHKITVLVHANLIPQNIIVEKQGIKLKSFQKCHIDEATKQFVYLFQFLPKKFHTLLVQTYLKQCGCQQINIKEEINQFMRRIHYNVCKLQLERITEGNIEERIKSPKLRDQIRKSIDIIFQQFRKLNIVSADLQNKYEKYITKNYELIFQLEKFEKKLILKQSLTWKHHNGGWTYVQYLINSFLSSPFAEVEFISSTEKYFYESKFKERQISSWVGFIHNVPMSQFHDCKNLELLLCNPQYQNKLKSCHGLFCLTKQISNRLLQQDNANICQVYYPITPPKKTFKPECLNKQKIRLLHVGQYLRKFDTFKQLQVDNNKIRKVIIRTLDQQLKNISTQNLQVIDYLAKDQYEDMLSNSVLFLDLYGAGGCTTVIQAISRNIPIIINRLPSLQEYLTPNYPLFYHNKSSLYSILENIKQQAQIGYAYLLNMDKTKFYGQNFLEQISASYIYQMIPLPNKQKLQFQTYNLSILIISYKRVENLQKIMNSLVNQTFKGSVEIIIWNNNSELSVKFIQKKFKSHFSNFVIIESSFNFYCIVRAAVCNICRGQLLLFLDDDILPYQNFLQTYVEEFKRCQIEYGDNLAITLRGNTFHTIQNKKNINFWSKYDNVKLLNSFDEESEINVIHMDTCLMKTELMQKCASYRLPELEFILVDDYWFSYILQSRLKAKLIKIKTKMKICQQFQNSQEVGICLYKQSKVVKQKNRFYCYHTMNNWPQTIQHGVNNFVSPIKIKDKQICKIKTLNHCLNVYKNNFCGWNIHSSVWLKNLIDLKNNYYCRVVRIGVVDIQNQFLNFFMEDGIKLQKKSIITKNLLHLSSALQQHQIFYIITLGNLPAKNLKHQRFTQSFKNQRKLWYDSEALSQLRILWQIIAQTLKNDYYCIGYDLINEPNFLQTQSEYQKKLVQIQSNLILAIKQIDKNTPIILQCTTPYKFEQFLQQLPQQVKNDESIIFSYHFYQPYVWTSSKNLSLQLKYPGPIPQQLAKKTLWFKNVKNWNREAILDIFKYNIKVALDFSIDKSRIFLGQFGCRIDRSGVQQYIDDIYSICEELNLNNCIYAYRQPWWKKMDYQYNQNCLKVIQKRFYNNALFFWEDLCRYNLKRCINSSFSWINYDMYTFQIKKNQQKSKNMRKNINFRYVNQQIKLENQPIFIIGCGRSGTTLMLNILSILENYLCLYEPLKIWLEFFPQFNIWQKDQVSGILESSQIVNSQSKIRQLNNVYSTIIKETKKKIIVDKQPQNLFKIEFLLKNFRNSKIIYIRRDKMQVVNSISKFNKEQWYGSNCYKFQVLCQLAKKMNLDIPSKGSESTIEDMASFEWQICQNYYQLCKKRISLSSSTQLLEVNYNDLVQQKNYIKSLQEILIFLGVHLKQRDYFIQTATKLIEFKS